MVQAAWVPAVLEVSGYRNIADHGDTGRAERAAKKKFIRPVCMGIRVEP